MSKGPLTRRSPLVENPPMAAEQRWLHIGIGVLLSLVLVVDVRMPLGFTPWLLYVVPLGLTFWSRQLHAPYIVAAFCTCLLVAGYLLPPPVLHQSVAVTNRTIGTATFWVLSYLIVEYKRLAWRLSRLTDDLQRELIQRTHDLSCAVSVLRTDDVRGVREEQDPRMATDEFKRQVTDVLSIENRRLREKVLSFVREDRPHPAGEHSLDATRSELERLGKQLEQLQRELLHS